MKNALRPHNCTDRLPLHPWPPYHMAAAAYSYQGWERRSSIRQFSWYAGDYGTEEESSEEFPHAKPTCPTCVLPSWDLVLTESRL